MNKSASTEYFFGMNKCGLSDRWVELNDGYVMKHDGTIYPPESVRWLKEIENIAARLPLSPPRSVERMQLINAGKMAKAHADQYLILARARFSSP